VTDGAQTPDLTLGRLGRILSEPMRLRILDELLAGIPLPAGVLAARLGIAPSTASSHLRQLTESGIVEVVVSGRSRMFTLTRADVADAVEALLRLTAQEPGSSLRAAQRLSAMRYARSCYDHLAGVLGVTLFDVACTRGWVAHSLDGSLHIPPDGMARCSDDLRIDVALPASRRVPVRDCFDWTERRSHLGGRLGAAILLSMIDVGWVRRRKHDRALTVTVTGRSSFERLQTDQH